MNILGIRRLGVALAVVTGSSQSYPIKPIEMVIHTSPGAGQDVIGRLIADISSREKLLPQPFVVVNRPGGSGVVASTFIKSKRGDPYYLLSVSTTISKRIPAQSSSTSRSKAAATR